MRKSALQFTSRLQHSVWERASVWARPQRTLCTTHHHLQQEPLRRHPETVANFGTVNLEKIEAPPPIKAHRTGLKNPADHTLDHEGFFYEVPQGDVDRIFGYRTLSTHFRNQIQIFRSCDIMVRSPGLEIISYIKKTNFDLPAVRYVLYGRNGAGKTMTMAYLLHYFASNGWLVFHVPHVIAWSRQYREIQESTFKPGRIDLPVESVAWLQNFLSQNLEYLKNTPNVHTHKKYIWSKREETSEGSSLLEIVDLGIKRPRYADDCIGVLAKEIKTLASEKIIKVAVLVDGVNALFSPTIIPRVDKTTVPPELISSFCHFKSILTNDWNNGAIVTTVDGKTIVDEKFSHDDSGQYLPRYLLRSAGWTLMDPFVPVEINDYKDKELSNCIDLYLEKRWLQHDGAWTDRGRDELKFVSGNNPGAFYDLSLRL